MGAAKTGAFCDYLTSAINGKIQVPDATELPENLVEVLFVDVLGQALHHNLGALCERGATPASVAAVTTTVTVTATTPAAATGAAPVATVAARRGW